MMYEFIRESSQLHWIAVATNWTAYKERVEEEKEDNLTSIYLDGDWAIVFDGITRKDMSYLINVR